MKPRRLYQFSGRAMASFDQHLCQSPLPWFTNNYIPFSKCKMSKMCVYSPYFDQETYVYFLYFDQNTHTHRKPCDHLQKQILPSTLNLYTLAKHLPVIWCSGITGLGSWTVPTDCLFALYVYQPPPSPRHIWPFLLQLSRKHPLLLLL